MPYIWSSGGDINSFPVLHPKQYRCWDISKALRFTPLASSLHVNDGIVGGGSCIRCVTKALKATYIQIHKTHFLILLDVTKRLGIVSSCRCPPANNNPSALLHVNLVETPAQPSYYPRIKLPGKNILWLRDKPSAPDGSFHIQIPIRTQRNDEGFPMG